MSKILLIDGSNYLFRAFHGLPELSTSRGEPTGAMKGFLGMLGRVAGMVKPDYAAIVFDAPGKNFRHEMYPEYKANRPPMPDDLRVQIAPLHGVLEALGWPLLIIPGVEADDVIASLAEVAKRDGHDVVIATGDKDMAQLVEDRVILLNTMNTTFYDREGVIEKYGVPPEHIIDYLALMGDKVDNVPGIEKCGPKTAAKWVNEIGGIDAIKAHAHEVTGKIGENLRKGLGFLDEAVKLVTIKRDCVVPGAEKTEDLAFRAPDDAALSAFAHRWEMSRAGLDRAMAAPAKRLLKAAPPAQPVLTEGLFAGLGEDQPAAPAASVVSAVPTAAAAPADAPVGMVPPEIRTPEEILRAIADDAADSGGNPDEILFEKLDTPIALEALRTKLTDPARLHEAPVALTLLWEGETRAAVMKGVAVALSPLDVHVWTADMEVTAKELSEALADWTASDAPKLLHDAKTAMHALASVGVTLSGTVDDTMLMSYVLEAHRKHELGLLAERLLRRTIPKRDDVFGKGAKKQPFEAVDAEAVRILLAEEAAATRACGAVMRQALHAEPELARIYETLERPLMRVLFKMERTGVAIDCFALANQSEELAQRIEELRAECERLAGHPFNISSPAQLGQVLFGEMGIPVVKKTASGAPSTDEEVLTELALDHALPKVVLEHRRLTKLRSTYLEKLPRMTDPVDGRVHTTFGQATAVTGRLASSDPNLQNIPVRTPEGRRVREAFVGENGNLIVSADYSQVELRIMAHLSKDQGLLSAFARGEDIHRSTAAEVFGRRLEDVTPDERRMAKVINFGLIYGMSAFGLAQNLGIDRRVAANYIDQYFARFPGIKRYMDGTRLRAREDGFVETAFGRRLWIPDIKSSRKNIQAAAERAAINAPMQGTAADVIKRAMLSVDAWLKDSGLKSRLILQVHDELILETPPEEVEVVRAKLPELMAAAATLDVPLVAEVGVGPNWEAAH